MCVVVQGLFLCVFMIFFSIFIMVFVRWCGNGLFIDLLFLLDCKCCEVEIFIQFIIDFSVKNSVWVKKYFQNEGWFFNFKFIEYFVFYRVFYQDFKEFVFFVGS